MTINFSAHSLHAPMLFGNPAAAHVSVSGTVPHAAASAAYQMLSAPSSGAMSPDLSLVTNVCHQPNGDLFGRGVVSEELTPLVEQLSMQDVLERARSTSTPSSMTLMLTLADAEGGVSPATPKAAIEGFKTAGRGEGKSAGPLGVPTSVGELSSATPPVEVNGAGITFTTRVRAPEEVKADVLALPLYARSKAADASEKTDILNGRDPLMLFDTFQRYDAVMNGGLAEEIKATNFTGKRGEQRMLFTAGKLPVRYVLLVGMGKREPSTPEQLRAMGAALARAAASVKAESVALMTDEVLDTNDSGVFTQAVTEGVILGSYGFKRYKTGKAENGQALERFTFEIGAPSVQAKSRAAIKRGRITGLAQNVARDLVNTPGIDATPSHLAEHARKIAAAYGLNCQTLGLEGIEREKMGGLLAIAKGSPVPPEFIVLTYEPKGKAKGHVALVGKGVTFDAGGISLKIPKGMELMKMDMGGAASVLGAMQAIGQLKPKVKVSAFIPAAENMPDGTAIKPGDIITMRSGKTVEIISTDAEGRLLLADAISYALGADPDVIVDLATLTGGAVYCCGELYTMMVGNHPKVVEQMLSASKRSGERMWELPLVEEYMQGYTSSIADMNNQGSSRAQTILGGLFMHAFVEGKPWAHLDTAATAWADGEHATGPKGATGVAVRTLVEFVNGFTKRSLGS